jgi:hypothetical protein
MSLKELQVFIISLATLNERVYLLIRLTFLVFHKGNITFEDVIHIARTMRPRSMAREFKGTLKEIVGTCVSVGCTIDGETPKEIMAKVVAGEYDDRLAKEQ